MQGSVFLALACLIGYLLGSIPFALVIGKVFFKADVRMAGSKNLGGTNAGRVLGWKAGLTVMTLDVLKVILALGITSLMPADENALITAGLAAAAGHCYPVFAHFKGGKAVAALYGFLIGMMLFGGYSPWIVFVPLVVFLLLLYLTKTVSLASIVSALSAALFLWLRSGFSLFVGALIIFDLLIIWRHRANIVRIMKHEESRIKWM